MGRRGSGRKKKSSAVLAVGEMSDDDFDKSCLDKSSTTLGAVERYSDDSDLLDEYLDALCKKKKNGGSSTSTREKALASIVEVLNIDLQHDFIEKRFDTLLHQCLNSIKKASSSSSSREIALASHVIGLIALTTGPGEKAQEIFEEAFAPIVKALKQQISSSTISVPSLMFECLAIITCVVGGEEETEKSLNILWLLLRAQELDSSTRSAVVSAWSFVVSTCVVDDQDNQAALIITSESLLEFMSYFSTLLDEDDDRPLRITVCDALALIFSIGKRLMQQDFIVDRDSHERLIYKVIGQVQGISAEAGGKGIGKKDLYMQRLRFRSLLYYINDVPLPTTIGEMQLNASSYVELIQMDFLRHFLQGGFLKHMQENQFLHDLFGFMRPKKKLVSRLGYHQLMSEAEKRRRSNKKFRKSNTRAKHYR